MPKSMDTSNSIADILFFRVTVSGKSGEDAKSYQEKEVD